MVRGISLVRDIPLTSSTYEMQVAPPVRVLIVQPDVEELPPIESQWDAGAQEIRSPRLVMTGQITLAVLPHATLRLLQDTLREAAIRDQPYHIVQFVGHGSHSTQDAVPYLVFRGEQGGATLVTPGEFATILNGSQLRLVFLNACATASTPAGGLAQGFAPALLSIGIPAVIGMQVAVTDRMAHRFGEDFYAALADGRSVDAALLDARRLIDESDNQAAVAVPVCYLRTGDSALLKPGVESGTIAPQKPWEYGRKLGQAVVWMLGLVATLLGIYQAIIWFQERAAPQPMTGSFNIGVAAFTEPGADRAPV
ncbi:MAG: CHAT domain-containing protein [Anaerolineales bacterium]|nr:CHAT domain-containing protein [Anaerolineales bacterium]